MITARKDNGVVCATVYTSDWGYVLLVSAVVFVLSGVALPFTAGLRLGERSVARWLLLLFALSFVVGIVSLILFLDKAVR